MPEANTLNIALAAAAALILLISFSAYAYTQASMAPGNGPDYEQNVLTVCEANYTWEQMFADFEKQNFTVDGMNYTGISLEALVLDAGVADPETHTYTLIAPDYRQDVSWDSIGTGYLIETGPGEDDFHRAIFPGSAHTFWVYNLVSIEVI